MRSAQSLYLLYQTTRCSFLAQEKNSALGLLWHLLNPLATTLVLFAVFSHVKLFRGIEHYPLYILIGVVQFNFFSQATSRAAQGMLMARPLILNTTVPREILVWRSVCLDGVTYLVELLLVAILVTSIAQPPGWAVLGLLPVVVGMFLLSAGVAFLLASAVVFLTDLVYIWSVTTRMLFFMTPIFYSIEIIDDPLVSRAIALNPLAQMIELARATLLHGGSPSGAEVATALAGPALAMAAGWAFFRATKARLADYV